jgi:RimJ/RimL family protein N-acetyltransferase
MIAKRSTLECYIHRLLDSNRDGYNLPGLPFRGDSIKIRCFRRNDEDARQRWAKFSDPYLTKFNFVPQGTIENDRTYKKLQDRIRLAVDNHDDALIGYVSFKPVKREPGVADLGICFSADQVSRGLGRETLSLVLPWAVESLSLERIVLEVNELNLRAIKLYKHFGFRKIAEKWCREENPALYDNYEFYASSSGIRIRKNHLELLTWTMEWKASQLNYI